MSPLRHVVDSRVTPEDRRSIAIHTHRRRVHWRKLSSLSSSLNKRGQILKIMISDGGLARKDFSIISPVSDMISTSSSESSPSSDRKLCGYFNCNSAQNSSGIAEYSNFSQQYLQTVPMMKLLLLKASTLQQRRAYICSTRPWTRRNRTTHSSTIRIEGALGNPESVIFMVSLRLSPVDLQHPSTCPNL
ncbi:hypothetical protein M758_UG236200 [Ceratodon purpureus]|nr:hypothetical protein M758_UG236200 [Ceratodon purpureus]